MSEKRFTSFIEDDGYWIRDESDFKIIATGLKFGVAENLIAMLNELNDENKELKKENKQLRKYKERLERINGGYGHLTHRKGLTANEWLIESQERELKKKNEQISDWIEQHSKDIEKISEQQATISQLEEENDNMNLFIKQTIEPLLFNCVFELDTIESMSQVELARKIENEIIPFIQDFRYLKYESPEEEKQNK